MTYYIYKISNTINQKLYIGKTNNPKYRWYKHKLISKDTFNKYKKYPIHFALAKYDYSNFTFEVIDQSENEVDILKQEIYYISYFKSLGMILYNITDGGEGVSGHIPSKETRDKISKANKGKLVGNKNWMFGKGNQILKEHNHFYGKHHSENSKNNMSNKRIGDKNPRAKLSEDIVRSIKRNDCNLSVKELANLYNVSIQTIYKILNGTNWGFVK